MATPKQHILIFIDWFEPGFKAGGPIRSVAHFIEAFHSEYDFSIVTTDRDLGDTEAYPGIEPNEWIQQETHRVYYASPEHRSYRHIRNHIFNNTYDILYVQSMFSLPFSFFPLWVSRALTPKAKRILAPRGMLHPGALALKARKKRIFLSIFRLLRLHKDLTFQATDAKEIQHIRDAFGEVDIHLAPNLPRTYLPPEAPLLKESGSLRLVYFSRISEKKGLHLLLEALPGLKSPTLLDLYGVQDEPAYWQRCQTLIEALPQHIQVAYQGTVAPGEAASTLQQYHALAMPTQGENFGHAIFEALAAGRPVLISDQTPWRDLAARKAGWDIPHAAPGGIGKALQALASMDDPTWQQWSKGARQVAQEHLQALDLEAVRQLFHHEAPAEDKQT